MSKCIRGVLNKYVILLSFVEKSDLCKGAVWIRKLKFGPLVQILKMMKYDQYKIQMFYWSSLSFLFVNDDNNSLINLYIMCYFLTSYNHIGLIW